MVGPEGPRGERGPAGPAGATELDFRTTWDFGGTNVVTTFFAGSGLALKGRCFQNVLEIYADATVDDGLLSLSYAHTKPPVQRHAIFRDVDAAEPDLSILNVSHDIEGDTENAAGTFTWSAGGVDLAGTWHAQMENRASPHSVCLFAGWLVHDPT